MSAKRHSLVRCLPTNQKVPTFGTFILYVIGSGRERADPISCQSGVVVVYHKRNHPRDSTLMYSPGWFTFSVVPRMTHYQKNLIFDFRGSRFVLLQKKSPRDSSLTYSPRALTFRNRTKMPYINRKLAARLDIKLHRLNHILG